jgi:hypothetical protein
MRHVRDNCRILGKDCETGRNEQGLRMHQPAKHDDVTSVDQPGLLAPDTSGMNFYRADPALTDLLRIHLPNPLFRHIEPHLDRLVIDHRVSANDPFRATDNPLQRTITCHLLGERAISLAEVGELLVAA